MPTLTDIYHRPLIKVKKKNAAFLGLSVRPNQLPPNRIKFSRSLLWSVGHLSSFSAAACMSAWCRKNLDGLLHCQPFWKQEIDRRVKMALKYMMTVFLFPGELLPNPRQPDVRIENLVTHGGEGRGIPKAWRDGRFSRRHVDVRGPTPFSTFSCCWLGAYEMAKNLVRSGFGLAVSC
jgi:hypothetical protein